MADIPASNAFLHSPVPDAPANGRHRANKAVSASPTTSTDSETATTPVPPASLQIVPPPETPRPALLNLAAYKHAAERILPPGVYDYYSGGSHDEETLRYNSRSFQPFIIRPRNLINVATINTTTTLNNPYLTLPLPLLLAPVALQCMAHDEGESGTARAAANTGTAMCVSTTATQSIEQIASSTNPHTTQLLFQLYVYNDHELTRGLVRRAERAGYRGLIVTIDAPYLGYKERDVRNEFSTPSRFVVANFDGPLRHMRKRPIGVGAAAVSESEKAVIGRSSAFSWHDLRALVRRSPLPVWVKGVLTAEDAIAACDAGCTGVIVSNHGGRQLDTVPAPIDVITDISTAVRAWSSNQDGSSGSSRRRVSVLMDGGVRRGSDIFKALALGADAVLIGRPLVWGLAYNGSSGVQQVVECLHNELRLCMALAGCRSIVDITRRHVQLTIRNNI